MCGDDRAFLCISSLIVHPVILIDHRAAERIIRPMISLGTDLDRMEGN